MVLTLPTHQLHLQDWTHSVYLSSVYPCAVWWICSLIASMRECFSAQSNGPNPWLGSYHLYNSVPCVWIYSPISTTSSNSSKPSFWNYQTMVTDSAAVYSRFACSMACTSWVHSETQPQMSVRTILPSVTNYCLIATKGQLLAASRDRFQVSVEWLPSVRPYLHSHSRSTSSCSRSLHWDSDHACLALFWVVKGRLGDQCSKAAA